MKHKHSHASFIVGTAMIQSLVWKKVNVQRFFHIICSFFFTTYWAEVYVLFAFFKQIFLDYSISKRDFFQKFFFRSCTLKSVERIEIIRIFFVSEMEQTILITSHDEAFDFKRLLMWLYLYRHFVWSRLWSDESSKIKSIHIPCGCV